MKICSWKASSFDARAATLAGLIIAIALPLGAMSPAHAQRHAAPHLQRGPAAEPSPAMGPQRGAQSQAPLRSEFRTALEPHGHWQHHARWGDVWIPTNRPRDWRPYTAGRWVYTNNWGWYWLADDVEASWGLITYHYGRWIYEDDLGWCWVPGEEWGPAWVQWRRPSADVEYVGWAPLPPDEVIAEYVDRPRFWVFVHGRDFIAPRVASVILPFARYDAFFRDTVVVNRTLLAGGRNRFAVNPGIAPSFIAAATRQPLRTYDVRPMVLTGTAPIQGAMQVRAQDLRKRDFRPRVAVQPTQNVVRAADHVRPAQPLAAGERGRLGDQPPGAAQRAPQPPSTTGQAPGIGQVPRQQSQRGQQQSQPQRQIQSQGQPRVVQPHGPTTEGRGAAGPRAQTPGERQRQQSGRSLTETRGPAQRGASQVERRGPAPPVTQGRSFGGGAPHTAPTPRMQGGATEGRGGGSPGRAIGGAPQRAPGGSGPAGPGAGHGPGGRH